MDLIFKAVLICSIFFLLSCADEKGVSSETVEKNLLEAYMVVTYDKNNIPRPAQADLGYYYIPLKTTGSKTNPKDGEWVRYDYASVLQDGTLWNTSLAEVAKLHNGFSYFTHYTSNYNLLESSHSYIRRGIADAMRNYIAVGDSVRLILPQSLVKVSANDALFASPYNASKPVTIDIAVREAIPSPLATEHRILDDLAPANYSPAKQDTVGFYIGELKSSIDTVVLKDGYTIEFLYTGKFLDGYMFETNVADTARAHNVFVFGTYNKLSCKLGEGDKSYPKGLIRALKKMKVGSTSVVLFTSEWAYGAAGVTTTRDSNGNKVGGGVVRDALVRPYESMMYYIQILSVDKNEKK